MCRTFRSRIRSSSAIWTSSGVLPTPGREATTPTFPRPRPPCIDFSKTHSGLFSLTSLRYTASPLLGLLGLLLAVLLDQLLADRGRDGGIAGALHRELRLALGSRSEGRREAEHLGEGDLRLDAGEAVALRRTDHDPAALHQDPDDAAVELGRPLDRDLHEGLEDLGVRLGVRLAPGAARGFLEGDVRRVDGV